MANEIPDGTRRFILEAFGDIDHLRIFLVMSAQRERIFTPGSLAANLSLTVDKVNTRLSRLLQNGLIEAVTEPDAGFRYRPASPGLAELAEEVTILDHEMPVSLIKLVGNRPAEPIQAFSDAFKLR